MSEAPRDAPLSSERRLAAIVFTDVAGYSARMQQDETGTMALVRADFSVMRDLCTKHGGEILKSTGDGLLMCFSSVVQAVASALQIQAGFAGRQAGGLQHRIGIHLGDVFREDGDVAGDGVNIAARLQTRARPGTLCVSQSVYDAVKGKLPMQAEPLGPQPFKNITEPITVYLLAPAGAVVPPAAPAAKPVRKQFLWAAVVLLAGAVAVVFWPRPTQLKELQRAVPGPAVPISDKSIAVLPFTNMSDDKDSGYFADGVHEDILTDLANLPELRIVSRTSVGRYRGTTKSIREIGAELGVAYILEGSVRRAGNQVRVTGQLIRAATDEHVWARHYDRELKDVFAIQSALATEIAGALQTAIDPEQRARIEQVATKVPAAYDRLLRARRILYDNLETKEEDFLRAESLLQEAVELDPDYAVAWSYLADLHANFIFQNFDTSPERRKQAKVAIERALQLAPDRPEVIRNYGAYFYHALRDYSRAGEQYRRALVLQPGDCETHLLLALQLRRQGNWSEALNEFGRAFDLDPTNVMARATYITTLMTARRYDEALRKIAPVALREKDPLAPPRVAPAIIRFHATGSTKELADCLEAIPNARRSAQSYIERLRELALFKDDWSEADRISRENNLPWDDPIEEATLQIALGRSESARRQMVELLKKLAAQLEQSPHAEEPLKQRAMAAALLGKNDLAREYLEQARKEIFSTHDSMREDGFDAVTAFVLLWTGDKDGALRTLTASMLRPALSAGNVFVIRHSPLWRPLRDDPRFEAFLNDPKNNAPLF